MRKRIPWALRRVSPDLSSEDIAVPISSVPEFIRAVYRIGREHTVAIPCYGHAGDGNVHALPMRPEELDDTHWYATLEAILESLYREAARLGGTISGEHGIGSKRRDYLPIVLDKASIEAMRAVKSAFDPNGILNPGKILPAPSTN